MQYFEEDIDSVETLLDVPITGLGQDRPIPLRNIATLCRSSVPTEITHNNLQSTIDLTMGVSGAQTSGMWPTTWPEWSPASAFSSPTAHGSLTIPRDHSPERKVIKGAMIELSGEYSRMQETFGSLSVDPGDLVDLHSDGGALQLVPEPLVILCAVPLGLVGVMAMLFLTDTAINVQSLLGVIFMVGIVVSNTVLMVDFAQNLRVDEGLTPDQAIRKAASIRARPVIMTALAAFFALIPMALATANGPRQRGERASRSRGHWRHPGRPGHHSVRCPIALFSGRTRRRSQKSGDADRTRVKTCPVSFQRGSPPRGGSGQVSAVVGLVDLCLVGLSSIQSRGFGRSRVFERGADHERLHPGRS